jgi:endonuclease/exonuclease/phosphatase family metal-dependent hydrolase
MKVFLNLNRQVNPSGKFTSRYIINLLFLNLLLLITACDVNHDTLSYRVMTFNIRFDNPADGINSWENRREFLASSLRNISPDIIGMQEVLERQLIYLDENLPEYDHVGVGREDGKTGGEYVPVFYRKDIFKMLDWGTFWLSATPEDTGSVGWDAALPRICTWVNFLDIEADQEFFYLNTHFDHMGLNARRESAGLILEFIRKETGNLPVILSGDFNCSPDNDPYSIFINDDLNLQDACVSVSHSVFNGEGTFNGFGSEKDPERIDMIFVKGGWKVECYEVLKLKDGGMFISDHWPVVAELKIKN